MFAVYVLSFFHKSLNTPRDNNEARKITWVQCNRCDAWVHCLCVGMQVEDVEASAFTCI